MSVPHTPQNPTSTLTCLSPQVGSSTSRMSTFPSPGPCFTRAFISCEVPPKGPTQPRFIYGSTAATHSRRVFTCTAGVGYGQSRDVFTFLREFAVQLRLRVRFVQFDHTLNQR